MASKRSYWHPVGTLIEKFMAPFLDTCADIHLESIKELKKANTQFQKVYKIVKNYNIDQELLNNIIIDNNNISEYINMFNDCNEYYNEEDVYSILDDVEKHLKYINNNVLLKPKENREFNDWLERIKEIKKQYKNKRNEYINQIKKSLAPANLWYLQNTNLVQVVINQKKIDRIQELVDCEELSDSQLNEAYSLAEEIGINRFEADMSNLLQTAYYLRMMIAIASESYKNNDNSKNIVEKCDGLECWIADNIADSVLVVTKWKKQNLTIEKNGSQITESIIDTGIKERFKYLGDKIDIYDISIRFKHIKGTFIRWLANFYDKQYYTRSAFLGYPKVGRKEYQAFCFARVCPHCRHLIFDYNQNKYLCNKNARRKN